MRFSEKDLHGAIYMTIGIEFLFFLIIMVDSLACSRLPLEILNPDLWPEDAFTPPPKTRFFSTCPLALDPVTEADFIVNACRYEYSLGVANAFFINLAYLICLCALIAVDNRFVKRMNLKREQYHLLANIPSQAEVVSDEIRTLTLRFVVFKTVTVVVMLSVWLLFFFWLFPLLGVTSDYTRFLCGQNKHFSWSLTRETQIEFEVDAIEIALAIIQAGAENATANSTAVMAQAAANTPAAAHTLSGALAVTAAAVIPAAISSLFLPDSHGSAEDEYENGDGDWDDEKGGEKGAKSGVKRISSPGAHGGSGFTVTRDWSRMERIDAGFRAVRRKRRRELNVRASGTRQGDQNPPATPEPGTGGTGSGTGSGTDTGGTGSGTDTGGTGSGTDTGGTGGTGSGTGGTDPGNTGGTGGGTDPGNSGGTNPGNPGGTGDPGNTGGSDPGNTGGTGDPGNTGGTGDPGNTGGTDPGTDTQGTETGNPPPGEGPGDSANGNVGTTSGATTPAGLKPGAGSQDLKDAIASASCVEEYRCIFRSAMPIAILYMIVMALRVILMLRLLFSVFRAFTYLKKKAWEEEEETVVNSLQKRLAVPLGQFNEIVARSGENAGDKKGEAGGAGGLLGILGGFASELQAGAGGGDDGSNKEGGGGGSLRDKGRLFKELVLDSSEFRTAVLDVIEERAMSRVDQEVDRRAADLATGALFRETERIVGTGVVRAGTEYARSAAGLRQRPQPPRNQFSNNNNTNDSIASSAYVSHDGSHHNHHAGQQDVVSPARYDSQADPDGIELTPLGPRS